MEYSDRDLHQVKARNLLGKIVDAHKGADTKSVVSNKAVKSSKMTFTSKNELQSQMITADSVKKRFGNNAVIPNIVNEVEESALETQLGWIKKNLDKENSDTSKMIKNAKISRGLCKSTIQSKQNVTHYVPRGNNKQSSILKESETNSNSLLKMNNKSTLSQKGQRFGSRFGQNQYNS